MCAICMPLIFWSVSMPAFLSNIIFIFFSLWTKKMLKAHEQSSYWCQECGCENGWRLSSISWYVGGLRTFKLQCCAFATSIDFSNCLCQLFTSSSWTKKVNQPVECGGMFHPMNAHPPAPRRDQHCKSQDLSLFCCHRPASSTKLVLFLSLRKCSSLPGFPCECVLVK